MKTCQLVRKNENKITYQVKMNLYWIINLDATGYCINNSEIFESLISRDERLTITSSSLRITGRGTAKIVLLNSSTAKLTDVLIMPDIGTNLLSTQALLAHRIENSQQIHETEFYKKDNSKIIAKGS